MTAIVTTIIAAPSIQVYASEPYEITIVPVGRTGADGVDGDAALVAHVAAADPHPQYATDVALAAGLATKINTSAVGAVNGVASLDEDGLVPVDQLPAIAPESTDFVPEGSSNLYHTAARVNALISAAVGSVTQAYSATLSALAGLTTQAFGRSLLELASAAALRTAVALPTSTTVGRLARYTDTAGAQGQTAGIYEDASGNVGIGKTSPASPLDVNGNFRLSFDVSKYFAISRSADAVDFQSYGAWPVRFQMSGGGTITFGTLVNFSGGIGDLGAPVNFGGGSSGGAGALVYTKDATNGATLQSYGSRPIILNPIGNGVSIGTTAIAPAAGLLVSGNVGIGTTSPGQKLVVQHAADTLSEFISGGLRTTNSGIISSYLGTGATFPNNRGATFTGTGGVSFSAVGSGSSLLLNGTGASAGLKFQLTDVSAVGDIEFNSRNSTRIIVKGAGNVGVGGISDPVTTLDVAGPIRKRTAYTVATLPAASLGDGIETYVTDSNATLAAGHGNVVAGGGANYVPVHSRGSAWYIG